MHAVTVLVKYWDLVASLWPGGTTRLYYFTTDSNRVLQIESITNATSPAHFNLSQKQSRKEIYPSLTRKEFHIHNILGNYYQKSANLW